MQNIGYISLLIDTYMLKWLLTTTYIDIIVINNKSIGCEKLKKGRDYLIKNLNISALIFTKIF